jgi:hypothetical protein
MKRPTPTPMAAAMVSASLALAVTGCGSCGHIQPEPSAHDTDTSSPAGSTPSPSDSAAAWRSRHPRDDAGNLIPQHAPPPADSASVLPKPGREPDWDLDTADAARDYVRRYALGTKRYGGALDCVEIRPSTRTGDKRTVEAVTAASCPGAGKVRDVFLVDVAGDRLTVDDKDKRDPLARWPDGSDPEGPPGPVQNTSDMRKWNGPLRDAVYKLQLVVIRVQLYGRGTYPVVTLAGWHGAVAPKATAEELAPLDEQLCRANDGAPLGILAGLDRTRILRVRCPGPVHWDTL